MSRSAAVYCARSCSARQRGMLLVSAASSASPQSAARQPPQVQIELTGDSLAALLCLIRQVSM